MGVSSSGTHDGVYISRSIDANFIMKEIVWRNVGGERAESSYISNASIPLYHETKITHTLDGCA